MTADGQSRHEQPGSVHEHPGHEDERTSLDVLENENIRILELAEELEAARGPSVEERAEYGTRAKLLIRHFATREAALLDVADGLARSEELEDLGRRFYGDPGPRRRHLDAAERGSRGVQGIYLNTAQDFDGELQALLDATVPDLRWELDDGIPAVRAVLDEERQAQLFHSADHVAKHAPTNLDPEGPQWWERAPVISRLITIVDHLRDYPTSTRDART